MGSGVVSFDLYSDHQPVLSAIMLWFAAGTWLLLAVVLGVLLACQHDRFAREAISPLRSRPWLALSSSEPGSPCRVTMLPPRRCSHWRESGGPGC
jgi:hypothetical protein